MGGVCALLARCPVGNAWADQVTDVDSGHNVAECSNHGKCDTETGECVCDAGFIGAACERSAFVRL